MAIDRGMGHQIVGVKGISDDTGGHDKIIDRDINVSRAGFEKEK